MSTRLPLAGLAAILACSGPSCGGQQDARSPDEAAHTDESGRVAPTSDTERRVLEMLAELPGDGEKTVGGASVQVGAPYDSASGRACRHVTITHAAGKREARLACRDASGWIFVPTVLATQGG